MPGFAPFMEDRRDEPIAANADITGPNDEVVGFSLGDDDFLVGSDPLVLVMPLREQEADGTFSELREIPVDEPSVLASELHFTTEAQIVADEHRGTGDNPGWERLVVRVPESENPAIIFAGLLGVDLHEAEVASAIMRQGVRLRADGQLGGGERALDGLDELMMWDRLPR